VDVVRLWHRPQVFPPKAKRRRHDGRTLSQDVTTFFITAARNDGLSDHEVREQCGAGAESDGQIHRLCDGGLGPNRYVTQCRWLCREWDRGTLLIWAHLRFGVSPEGEFLTRRIPPECGGHSSDPRPSRIDVRLRVEAARSVDVLFCNAAVAEMIRCATKHMNAGS
jgi:hypothetical protein